jgi:ubiquinone/menaquinone biosynthesis C-methylase UbiE
MSDSAARPSRAYILTHTNRERRRLARQASIINPFTNRLLGDAGIARGMHVLDFACGVGDLSLIAGRLVSPHGSVTGIDIDPEALAIAAERAQEEGLDHVRFIQADLGAFEPDTHYDAVIARHILIHTPEPVELIRRARRFVRPGGIVAFQEFDLSFFCAKFYDTPVWAACANAIATLFQRAGLPARAGSLLYTWFLEAGLPIPECRLEFPISGGEDSLYYEWLAETMRSLMPKMVALGVVQPDDLDVDQLEEMLRREAINAGRPCIAPPMGAAFVRIPESHTIRTSS